MGFVTVLLKIKRLTTVSEPQLFRERMAVFNILSTSAGAGATFSFLSSSSSFLILIIILTIIVIVIIIILIIITVIKNSQPLVFITSLLSLLKPNQNHLQIESSLKWIPISSPSQVNFPPSIPFLFCT